MAVSPGTFVSPNLQKHCAEEMAYAKTDARTSAYMASPEQACSTSVYAALSPEPLRHAAERGGAHGTGFGAGLYLEGTSVAGPVPPGGDGLEYGYGPGAFDKASEEKLWEVSKKLVGVE